MSVTNIQLQSGPSSSSASIPAMPVPSLQPIPKMPSPHYHIPNFAETREFWSNRIITSLTRFEAFFDAEIPYLFFQRIPDSIGSYIESKFAPLTEFNNWLNANDQGDWLARLKMLLVKLPAKVARNIVQTIYQMVKAVFYTAVHPINAVLKLAKLIVSLLSELTKPENWSRMGGQMIGASLGQAVIGNPLSVLGIAIGATLSTLGLTIGMLEKAILDEQGHSVAPAGKDFISQMDQLLEALTTGFCMGIIAGVIQRMIRGTLPLKQAKEAADKFIAENKLPPYSSIEVDSSGTIHIKWENWHQGVNDLEYHAGVHKFTSTRPDLATFIPKEFTGITTRAVKGHLYGLTEIKMEITPQSSQIIATATKQRMESYADLVLSRRGENPPIITYHHSPLEKLNLTGIKGLYPTPSPLFRNVCTSTIVAANLLKDKKV